MRDREAESWIEEKTGNEGEHERDLMREIACVSITKWEFSDDFYSDKYIFF